MNSAARLLNEQVIERSWSFSVVSSSPLQWIVNGLLLAILLSSLAIVYVTNQTRSYTQQLQTMQQTQDAVHEQYGQLLLERSTLATGARIEQIAQQKLSMETPKLRKVVVIK